MPLFEVLLPKTPATPSRASPCARETCKYLHVPRLRTLVIAAVVIVMTDVTWDGTSLHVSFGLTGRKRFVQLVIP